MPRVDAKVEKTGEEVSRDGELIKVFKVQRPGGEPHVVRVECTPDVETPQHERCDCKGYRYRRDCKHITAVYESGHLRYGPEIFMKRLELRENQHGAHVLLVEYREVLGVWAVGDDLCPVGDTDGTDERNVEVVNYLLDRDSQDRVDCWSETWPDETDPDKYGDLVHDDHMEHLIGVTWTRFTHEHLGDQATPEDMVPFKAKVTEVMDADPDVLSYDWSDTTDPDGLRLEITCATLQASDLITSVFEGKHGQWLGVTP